MKIEQGKLHGYGMDIGVGGEDTSQARRGQSIFAQK